MTNTNPLLRSVFDVAWELRTLALDDPRFEYTRQLAWYAWHYAHWQHPLDFTNFIDLYQRITMFDIQTFACVMLSDSDYCDLIAEANLR